MNSSTTLERLAVALTSKNLKLKETVSDVDYLIALGMIGIKNKMAGAMLNLHLSGNLSSYKEARRATVELTRRLSLKRDWKLDTKDQYRIADAAWKMYLMPVCPKCTGRKYQVAEGTPLLTARPCQKCQGTGLRHYPSHHGSQIKDVVNVLASIEDVAGAAIRAKMRSR